MGLQEQDAVLGTLSHTGKVEHTLTVLRDCSMEPEGLAAQV